MCCVMPPASPAATRLRADVVEQRGLAVVDVAHDGDHRRARHRLVLRVGFGLFLEEGIGIVELGGHRRVAHLLDDDHRGLLVELLVDGDHLAQLHQLLDDLGGLHRHLVRQVGDADRLRNVHFLGLEFGRRHEGAAERHRCGRRGGRHAGARQPARPAPAGAARCGLEGALLRGVVGPARRELLRLDRFLVARLGAPCPARRRPACRPSCGSCP